MHCTIDIFVFCAYYDYMYLILGILTTFNYNLHPQDLFEYI